MPITSTHPDYDAHADTWRTLRDAFDGDAAIKAGGTRYLPQPSGLTDAQYAAYLARAAWFGATKRTIYGLRGAVFRKEPSLAGEDPIKADLDDITGTGVSWQAFLKMTLQEVLLIGRYGALVEWNDAEGRPYWCGFPPEAIINWRTRVRHGKEELTLVVVKETVDAPDPTDAYAVEQIVRYRALSLDPEGWYTVQVAEERPGVDANGTATVELFLHPPMQPTKRGARLPFIPFAFFSPTDVETSIEASPVQDLVTLNLRHWRRSVDYEHGLHLTALPTGYVTGHDPRRYEPDLAQEGKGVTEIALGSSSLLFFPEAEARVGMLEFQGHGLGAFEAALDADRRDMATVGARLLEERAAVNETATAVRLRQSGDESSIRTIAHAVSQGASQLLRWHAWWAGATDDPNDQRIVAALNQAFTVDQLSPQELTSLMQALQGGHISWETWYYNLQRAEMTQPGIDAEVEQERIQMRAPILPDVPPSLHGGG